MVILDTYLYTVWYMQAHSCKVGRVSVTLFVNSLPNYLTAVAITVLKKERTPSFHYYAN